MAERVSASLFGVAYHPEQAHINPKEFSMRAIVFAFPVMGLACCLFIALRPQHMERHVQRVQRAWGFANTLEKIGLVFMCVPIPGPFDEAIGFVFLGLGRVQRIVQRRKAVRPAWIYEN